MYLAGVSVRRVEDITEALWGTRVSPSTVSNLNKKIYAKIEAWEPKYRRRASVPVPGRDRDEAQLGGGVRNVSLLVASAVNSEGFRKISAFARAPKKTDPAVLLSCASWSIGVSKASR